MPRTARIKDNFGIYYISQHCTSTRSLFENNKDRDKFLNILESIKKKFNIKVYAYCIAHSNEYHLILDTNGSDISKVMKGLNISYAIYVNHSKTLFKDRYKSYLINDHTSLMEAIYSIHNRKISSEVQYNSCCFYNQESLFETGLLNPGDVKLLEDNSIFKSYKESCKNCITSMEEARRQIDEYAKNNNFSYDTIIKDKEYRNKLISKIRKESTLSLKDIGILFGGLSESTISKIISKN